MQLAYACEHKDRKRCAQGMCKSCYQTKYKKYGFNAKVQTSIFIRIHKKRVPVTNTRKEVLWWHEHRPTHCTMCEKLLGKRAHLDVEPQTGKIRAWVCGGCNLALGYYDPNPKQELAKIYQRTFNVVS